MPTRRALRTSPLSLLALACVVACGGGGSGSDSDGDSDGDTDTTTAGATDTTAAPTTSGTTAWEEESESEPEQPVTVEWSELELRLVRGGDVLLRFPADGFQLGVVAALDDASSYDPFFLAPDQWLTVTAAEALGGAAAVDVRLSFGTDVHARLTVTEAAPGRFHASLVPEPGGPVLAYMRLRPIVDAGEGFYGLGEHFDAAEHRGRVRAMQLEYDPQIESQYNEAHVPVPFITGTRGWGLFVEDPHAAVFDVAAAAPDRVEATFGTGPDTGAGLVFHLYAANHPLDVTRHYYATTGAPKLPAPWALGPWIWRDENDDQAQVESDIATIRELDLATSAIWIDRPYQSAVGVFDWNPTQFPDPQAMIAKIHDLGLRLALWHVPYVDDDPAAAEMRAEAEAGEFFPLEVGLITSQWGEPLDLTNPAAFEWWQDHIREYTDNGVDGFKLDYAEDIVVGLGGARTVWQFADGSSERTMHKLYQLLYHRAYAELLPESGGFLLCRAGTYGDQQNVSVIWPGDLDANMAAHREPVDDDGESYISVGGLPAALTASLGLGPSGFPFFASDTGGYRHAPPDRETFVRWFEYTALTPVMQVGTGSSDVPWEFTPENGLDDESLAWYRQYARLHLRLFPYVWTHAQLLAGTGRPLQRPLGLAYPELGVHPSDTYLLGRDLLVAPVVARGATSRKLSLPPGAWLDWWTGEVLQGDRDVTVDAPLGTLPLFLRVGGIVPLLRPTIDTLAPTTAADVDSFAGDPGLLYARVAPGPVGTRFDLYDGTALKQRLGAGSLRLEVAPGEVFTAGVDVEVVAMPPVAAVTVDDAPLSQRADAAALDAANDGWFYAADLGGTLRVKLGPGAHLARATLVD
ncbi:TIM-barrel domain-containing protein [Nannocystis pusilla]|uniref:Glycoside hydrolase family 31 protein n=1 Tax=Nannocystis pusilla TaxID=889268 RepID=A0ABS7U3W1_9BACT|nr:TIM-barrel domain-containing protein [Nannocystis pusilla]MBZ5715143.1 hypothetical protein [Nannocystis pusilla]